MTTARAVGKTIAERGWGVVYGGAKVGTMGAVADGALRAGGEVFGVIPERLSDHEIIHDGLSELYRVDGMHTRKAMMTHLSDALVILPGGFGTLDELFEALTWRQLGYHDKPIGLLGADFWKHLVAHIGHAVEAGFIRPELQALYVVEDEVPALLDRLADEVAG